MSFFHHEQIYRGKGTLDRIRDFPIAICGAGAIGSNLAENLVRQGFGHLTVIDKDRVQDRNINTQVWMRQDIGSLKVNTLRFRLYDVAGIEIRPIPKELNLKSKARSLFGGCYLVVDAFDNSKSRQLVKAMCNEEEIDCLHIGFSGEYGEVVWDEEYSVPAEKGEDDCDYPLARNLIMLLVGVASEVIVRFITERRKDSYTVTLGDFKVQQKESFG